jgi:diguanylate cyclase (GGDEF)-like protein
MRRTRYGIVGGLLAPAHQPACCAPACGGARLSIRSVASEVHAEYETYAYSAASTALAFTVFGSVLGRYAERLAQLATTEPLTALSNPCVFEERLRQEIDRAGRDRRSLSLLIIDVDALKRVNDQYGHEAGDDALRSVAGAIRNGIREIDLGARLGGGEFGALAPRTDEKSAVVLAERLRALLVKSINGRPATTTTVSIGIASLTSVADQKPLPVSLIRLADHALYQAKRAGGNSVAIGDRSI